MLTCTAPNSALSSVGRYRSPALAGGIDKINRPSRLRRAIGFDLSVLSVRKASPNDTGIVIIVIIIVVLAIVL